MGRYQLIEELGRGGMATVHLARDPTVDRQVAIKILPRQFLHETDFRERFMREARTIAQLEHSAIVPVYDFGEENEQPYIVMRYLQGGTLSDRVRKGPLPLEESIRIVSRIAAALAEAHSRGIVHRDLKPANILFDQNDEPFLSDFGIVKLAEASGILTGTGVVGTPTYMSPEQAYGDRNIDGRADIYSLAVIVFEMLTGSTPYEADTPMGVAMKHILEPVPQVLSIKPDLPGSVALVLEKALSKKPDERFQTVEAFAEALEEAANKDGTKIAVINKPAEDDTSPETISLPPADLPETRDTEQLLQDSVTEAPKPTGRRTRRETRRALNAARRAHRQSRPGVPVGLVILLVFFGLVLTVCVGVFAFGQGASLAIENVLNMGSSLSGDTTRQEFDLSLEGADTLMVELTLDASRTQLESTDDGGVAARGSYDHPVELEPLDVAYAVDEDGIGTVDIVQTIEQIEPQNLRPTLIPELDLDLPESIPIDLEVNGGIGDLELDLTNLTVSHLNVVGGAGLLRIRLPQEGTLRLNMTATVGGFVLEAPDGVPNLQIEEFQVLGGAGETRIEIPAAGGYTMNVQTGIGHMVFEVPPDLPIRFEIAGGMTEISVLDRRLLDVGENEWATEDFDEDDPKAVIVRVQTGVGSIEIIPLDE